MSPSRLPQLIITPDSMSEIPSPALIQQAAERIAGHVSRTPVLTSRTIDSLVGAQLFFKCENLQRIGAFKARGAHNAVLALSPEAAHRGVVTHSSGNHAAALALAAKTVGARAHIVMPSNSARIKVASVERLGGQITFCEPNTTAREATASAIVNETGATLVHPFDDWNIIAGQGTAALELLDEVSNLDSIIVPVGGGGLLSGTALAAHPRGVRVFAVEPQGACDAYESFRSGSLIPLQTADTICDGLRTSLGQRPFSVIERLVADIVTVNDADTLAALQLVWQVMKIIIEPSSAVVLAALLQQKLPQAGSRIGVILSGGNVDLQSLVRMMPQDT